MRLPLGVWGECYKGKQQIKGQKMVLLKEGKEVDITKYFHKELVGFKDYHPKLTIGYIIKNDDKSKELADDGKELDEVIINLRKLNSRLEQVNKDRDALPAGSERQEKVYEEKVEILNEAENLEQQLEDAREKYLPISTLDIKKEKGESKEDFEERKTKEHTDAISDLRDLRAIEFIEYHISEKASTVIVDMCKDVEYNVTARDMKIMLQNALYKKENDKGKS